MNRKDRYVIAFLVLLPFIWYFREIFSDARLMTDDLLAQYHPWWTYARDRVLSGEWPLWNPYVFCGMPYHINPENLLFYPLKIPLMLLPFFDGAIWLRVIHAGIASVGMYMLLRHWRLCVGAAAAGAVMFTYGSFMSYEFIHIPYIITAAWLPWELLMICRLFNRPERRQACTLAAVTAMCFLGGSPGIFFIVQVMCGLVALFLLIDPLSQKQWGRLRQLAGSGVLAITLFIALTAILLFPVIQFTGYSPRAGGLQSVESFIRQSIPPAFMQLLLWPLLHWRNGAPYPPIYPMQVLFIPYVGILGTLLAGIGLLFNQRGHALRAALFISLVLGILLALGQHTALYPFLFRHLNIIRWFRWPHDYLLLTYSALAILAAFGIDALCGRFKHHPRHHIATGILLLIILADLYGFGMGCRVTRPLADLEMTPLRGPLNFMADHANGERVSVASTHGHAYFRGQQQVFKTMPPRHADPDWLSSAWPTLDRWCEDHADSPWAPVYAYRAAIHPQWDAGSKTYPVNASMLYGYREICGYDPFMIQRVADLLGAAPVQKVWNWCDVKYVATPERVTSDQLLPVVSNEYLIVYENKDRIPRAFIPQRVQTGLSAQQILARIRQPSFSPMQCSLVEGNTGRALTGFEGAPPQPEIISSQPEHIMISASNAQPALLVLHDPFYPGWQVRVDGQKKPLLRVNYAFCGVELPPGQHRVEFRYRPLLLYVSATISVIAWLSLLVFFIRQKGGPQPVRIDEPHSPRGVWIVGAAWLLIMVVGAVLPTDYIISVTPLPSSGTPCILAGQRLKETLPPGTFSEEVDGGVRLFSNTYWGYRIDVPADGPVSIRMTMRGTPMQGIYPMIALTLDRSPVIPLLIKSEEWMDYQQSLYMIKGQHVIGISYVNDEFRYPEDRNLDLRAIEINTMPAGATR